jgi:CheY-like chemotaxis protein
MEQPASNGGDDERRRFLEQVSREFRAPMSGVLAVAQLLSRQPLTSDAQAYVRTIVDSAETLLRRLDEAMDLVLGDSGRLQVTPAPARLRETMDEIQAEWQGRRRDGPPLLISYDGEPELTVMADAARLKQLFDQLIGSALRVTTRGAVEASLKARCGPEGVYLEGRVRDAGPPLATGQLARIFESTDSSEYSRGSGFSLPLCRRVVEAMNGSIRAEANVGPGVSVIFQVLTPKVEAAAAPTDSVQTGGRGSAHVLVVDDNATNRMVAESLCEMFDCTSETAEDGVEAVEAARSGRFDLILMDIKMPRMDGVQATRAIRAMPGPIGQVPIIALTANADPDDARSYLASGMSSVVEKPIKPDRLLQAMNAVLGGNGAAGDKTTRAA